MAQVPATQGSQGGRLAARREHPLQRLQRDFDTLFNRLLGGWLTPFDRDLAFVRLWDFDVQQNDQGVIVRAELPGFEPNEVDVQLSNDVLTIKAEKVQKDNGHEEHRRFYRTVTLPAGIDAEKAQATYRNGVLELHLPRRPEAQAKHIAVQGEKGPGREAGSGTSREASK